MFYMPRAKVNICKKSLRAGAQIGGALCHLPGHGLAQSLAAEGGNRLCLHQVALFEDVVSELNVLRMMLECAVIDEPRQWHL